MRRHRIRIEACECHACRTRAERAFWLIVAASYNDEELARLDEERGASLLATLEEFLHRRGNISATSDALYVHPNTLRQRLRRIADLTGIDLRRDDWLMVEIAVKMVRLREALGATTPHT